MPLKKEVLSKYVTECFIETGTYMGEGIDVALECGFPLVKSVELSKGLYSVAQQKYKDNDKVHLFCGASQCMLREMIEDVKTQATFWLDGHWSGGNTGKSNVNSPLRQELHAIKKHPIKNHIIMIDDLRLFAVKESDYGFELDLEDIKNRILEINPNYEFSLEDGHVPNDVLVAVVK